MSNPDRRHRTLPMVFTPSVELVAFLVHAIRQQEQQYRRNGAVAPDGLLEFVSVISFGVTQGQAGSAPAQTRRTEQIEPMTPRLVTYETAADLLAISVSTLKRRIVAGDFHPISIGGAARIRVAEIDDYIAAAAADPTTSITDLKGA